MAYNETEYRGSYFQLMEERLHIEAWDKNTFLLNRFIGYASIPMIDIVSGSFKQAVVMTEPLKDNKGVRQVAAITFNCYFEEIWDFYL